MPTYQYECTTCGKPLEVVQRFTDDALTECPACGGRLRKVFSAVGVVFKGSGFYRTDSREGSKTPVKADAGAASGEAGSKSGEGKDTGGTGAASPKSADGSTSSSGSDSASASRPAAKKDGGSSGSGASGSSGSSGSGSASGSSSATTAA